MGEAEALGTVLTRLVSTPDEQLENLLVRLMPVVIRKLELGQPAVQQKVLAILSHVNKRLKPLPAVQLPLRELAELYGDASSAPLSRNFALVYVEKACARAKAVDVAAELGRLLPGIGHQPKEHQLILLKCLLWALPAFVDYRPPLPGQAPGQLGSGLALPEAARFEDPTDRGVLLSFASQLLCFQRAPGGAARPGVSAALAALLDASEALAQSDADRRLGRDALREVKLGALGWLSFAELGLGALPCVLLAASDGSDAVAARAETLLRALPVQAALEDGRVAAALLDAALGYAGPPAFGRVPPVAHAPLVRALGALSRSRAAAREEPLRLFGLAEATVAVGATQRERLAGAELAAWVLQEMPEPAALSLAPRAARPEALGSMAPAFRAAPGLRDLLAPVRATALAWTTQLLDADDAEARHMAILAAGDASNQIATSARRWLEAADAATPSFERMLECLLRHHPEMGQLPLDREPTLGGKALAAAITFLERVRSTEDGVATPETSDSTRAKTRYAALLAAALSPRAPTALVQGALLALLEVLAGAGGALAPAERAALGAAVEPLVAHPDPSARRRAARALCLLGDDVGADRRRRWAQVALAPGSRLEERLGAVEALGCASCWAALRRGEPCEEEEALRTCALDDASDAQCAAIFWLSLLARARAASGESWFQTQAATLVSGLAERLERPGSRAEAVVALGFVGWVSESSSVWDAATDALLELSLKKDAAAQTAVAGEALCLVFSGSELGLDVQTVLETDWKGLRSWREGAGEAPSAMQADGHGSLAQSSASPSSRAATQAKILDYILDRCLSSTRKEQRAAGTAWLVALLEIVGGGSDLLVGRLGRCQEALVPLLRDEAELTQELASQGLILVHALGNSSEDRESLARQLIVLLTGNAAKRPAAALGGATDAANGMGTAVAAGGPGGAGPNASAGAFPVYRELAGIAAAIGQPQLLVRYEFMRLALQTGSGQKQGPATDAPRLQHLKAIAPDFLPRLYRLRFDPDPKVQRAMTNVWLLLVDDSAATLTQRFAALGAAAAAAELLRGRSWAELEPVYGGFWAAALRLLDDVHRGVRAAALRLVSALRSSAVAALEAARASGSDAHLASASGALDAAVPPLLAALASPSAEVAAVALHCLAGVVTDCPAAVLRPQLPRLAPALLEALSGLEDARLNYVEQHAAALGLDAERLDEARVKAAHSGALGDALDARVRPPSTAPRWPRWPGRSRPSRAGASAPRRARAPHCFCPAPSAGSGRAGWRARPGTRQGTRPGMRSRRSWPRSWRPPLARGRQEARRALAGAAAAVLRAKVASRAKTWRAIEALLAATGEGEAAGRPGAAAALVLERVAAEAPEALAPHALRAWRPSPTSRRGRATRTGRGEPGRPSFDAATCETGRRCGCLPPRSARPRRPGCAPATGPASAPPRWPRDAAAAAPEALAPHAGALLETLLGLLPGRVWEGKAAVLDAVGPVTRSALVRVVDADARDALVGETAEALARAAGRKGADAPYREAALRALSAVLDAAGEAGPAGARAALPGLLALEAAADPEAPSPQKELAVPGLVPCLVNLSSHLASEPADQAKALDVLASAAIPGSLEDVQALADLAARGHAAEAVRCLARAPRLKALSAAILPLLERAAACTDAPTRSLTAALLARLSNESGDQDVRARAAAAAGALGGNR
ncbi:hypothetical protein QBZ16_002341 [Prototheca wickerhamii]|uniref:Uncharacterized protein n=1 Tax=Prototheca wickerhamii TaxID=3111 RepID=A0AAD9ILS2_PROWI|nr:hypothetical protein QBZ16_002341 [Prototheca wickerhamii]